MDRYVMSIHASVITVSVITMLNSYEEHLDLIFRPNNKNTKKLQNGKDFNFLLL